MLRALQKILHFLIGSLGKIVVPLAHREEVVGRQRAVLGEEECAARLRNERIGFIFQSFNLIPDLNVYDNVDVPLRYRRLTAADRNERINSALELVGLASRMKHMPSQLSGGQQQRVAIARAIAGDPAFLLADEPTGNLDSLMSRQVMDLLEQINEMGTTILLVTHDPELARRAQRNVHLIDGQISDFRAYEPRPAAGGTAAAAGAAGSVLA